MAKQNRGELSVAAGVHPPEQAVEHVRIHHVRVALGPVEITGGDLPVAVAVQRLEESRRPAELVARDPGHPLFRIEGVPLCEPTTEVTVTGVPCANLVEESERVVIVGLNEALGQFVSSA